MGSMKLEGNKDSYEIDEVDCFEKPIGIILEGMREGYAGLFYMFLKFTQAYNVNGFLPKRAKSTIETEMYIKKRMLKEEFNIEIQSTECKEQAQLHKFMEEKLVGSNVVLIPGNLKELYYSKYYRRRNWPHLFLIKSYDPENQLYYTLDSSQFFKENMALYRDFVIPYHIMENVHFEYKKDFFPYIYYIDSGLGEQLTDANTIINHCLNYYLQDRNEQPYREIYYMNCMYEKNGSQDEVTYYSERLFRTNKAKKLFFHELEIYLESHEYPKDELEAFHAIAEKVSNAWKKVINICFVHARKGQKLDVDKEISDVILLEENLYDQFVNMKKFTARAAAKGKETHQQKQLENNGDHVIAIEQEGAYTFTFPKGKVYTAWFKDDSPKVVLGNMRAYKEGFSISCTVQIEEAGELSNFHAGIFLRTDHGYVYFWGTHCGNLVRMDLSGINTDIYTYEKAGEELSIRVSVDKHGCKVETLERDIVEDSHEVSLTGNVVEVGVGCKTWDDSDFVKLTFKEMKLEGK